MPISKNDILPNKFIQPTGNQAGALFIQPMARLLITAFASRCARRERRVEGFAPRPISSLRADSRASNQSFEGSERITPAGASALRYYTFGPSTRRYVKERNNK